jgi:hypothetical protein
MSQIGGLGASTPTPLLTDSLDLPENDDFWGDVPEEIRKEIETQLGGLLNELPDLMTPLLASGLSLEVLIEAIGAEERKTGVKTATESLKAKAQSRQEANAKALEEIKDRLETLRKEEKLAPFLKAFKIIGMVLGAIASIATIALGAMTGNPLMVAAGVVMAVLVVDSIISEASDGKYSMAAGVSALAEACGASEEAAKWIGFGFQMAMILTSVVLSFGAAGAASATTAATQVMGALVKVQQATAVVSGLVSIGSGAAQIAQAVLEYDMASSHARTKELEAILERLRESIETEEDFVKFLMENLETLMAKVGEIVKEAAETSMALAAGKPPAMA